MAARKYWRFYVYAMVHEGEVVYIGKGSRGRLVCQRKIHGCDGYEIARFERECDAFRFERKAIAEYKPVRNKSLGGDGGRCGIGRNKPWTPDSLAKSRLDTAKFLLSKDMRGHLPQSEIDEIRNNMHHVVRVDGWVNGTRC